MPQPPIYNRPPPHPETASQALTGQAASWMFPSLNMSYFNLQELRCDVNKMACIRGFYTGYACQNPMESFFILGGGGDGGCFWFFLSHSSQEILTQQVQLQCLTHSMG